MLGSLDSQGGAPRPRWRVTDDLAALVEVLTQAAALPS